jgi:thiamine pyrophosphate-dependent acetolactate synthase large subunit-like protein
VAWPFAALAGLWGGRGFTARTPREFREALAAAWAGDAFALIDVKLARGDVSPILKGFVRAFKERVYVARPSNA